MGPLSTIPRWSRIFWNSVRGFAASMRGQIRFPPHIDRIQSRRESTAAGLSRLVRSGYPESIDGIRRIAAVQRKLSVKCWEVIQLHQRIFREKLAQIIGQRLRPARVPCERQSERAPYCTSRPAERPIAKCARSPCFGCIAEQGFPQPRITAS